MVTSVCSNVGPAYVLCLNFICFCFMYKNLTFLFLFPTKCFLNKTCPYFCNRSLPPELQGMLNQDFNQGLNIGGPVNWRNVPGRNSQTRFVLVNFEILDMPLTVLWYPYNSPVFK